MPLSPPPSDGDADGWEGDELSVDGDGKDGDGKDGEGRDGEGREGEGEDGEGNDGDGKDGIGDDVGEGRVGGEGIGLGPAVPGNGLGIPRWEDGSGTWQAANAQLSTTARTPIADGRTDGFHDERK